MENNTKATYVISKEEYDLLQQYNKRKDTYVVSKEEYDLLQQYHASSPKTYAAHPNIPSGLDSPWIIDSGASHHITGNQDTLTSLRNTPHPPVRIANGSACPVRGIGSVSNSKNLNLSSVLFVPEFPSSLLSVSKITKQNNCYVSFYPTHCVLRDLETNRVIGTGFESKDLYYMHMSPLLHPTANLSCSNFKEVHFQLGHPSLAALKQMRPDCSVSDDFHCESCQLGKHIRRSYPPKTSSRASTLFELVYSDVWGPCPTKTPLLFQYIITFIDDYSRVTWVYLMKTRSETCSLSLRHCLNLPV